MKAGKTAKTGKLVPKKAAADNTSTEDKIKNAARAVFYKKGFASTRTRDIAEEAGINLALLNYYFRSKQKLFDIIMLETVQGFLKYLLDIFNDNSLSLETKIETFAEQHIELLMQNPGIPIFMLNELRTNPGVLVSKIGGLELIQQSHFVQQLQFGIKQGKIAPVHPLHFIMNMLSMTTFPFVASPLLKGVGNLSEKDFNQLMQERKKNDPAMDKSHAFGKIICTLNQTNDNPQI